MSDHAGDDLTCFRRAMAEGDRGHASHHLAGIVAEGASSDARRCVSEFLAACEGKPDDLLDFAPLGENVYFGVVVLRAIFLAHTGRAHEGLPFVLRAQPVVPDVDLVAWTDGWLTDAVVAAIDIDALVQGAFKISASHPYTERVIQMLVRILETREPHGSLALATARLVRMTGDVDRAITIANDAHRRGPSYYTCVARGAAYREVGRWAEAIEAYEDAVALEPDDDAVRLDIGDLSISAGDTERAARAYAQVLVKDPRHEWAWPSQLYLLARDGDDAARRELGQLATGGNHRAQDLFGKIEPYVSDLQPPSASCIQSANDAVARGYTPSALAVSSLEPPSAIATFRETLTRAGKDVSGVSISFGNIPTPDPRVPRARVEWQLWKYGTGENATVASPALSPPRAEIAGAIAELANSRFELARWSASARGLAQRFGEGAVTDVLATMAFPPKGPDGAPIDEVDVPRAGRRRVRGVSSRPRDQRSVVGGIGRRPCRACDRQRPLRLVHHRDDRRAHRARARGARSRSPDRRAPRAARRGAYEPGPLRLRRAPGGVLHPPYPRRDRRRPQSGARDAERIRRRRLVTHKARAPEGRAGLIPRVSRRTRVVSARTHASLSLPP